MKPMTNYEANEEALQETLAAVSEWATILDPYDVKRHIEAALLGALMSCVDPETFRAELARCERIAGKPVEL